MNNTFIKIKMAWSKFKPFATAHKPLTIVSVIILISLVSMLFGKGGTASATSYVYGRVQRGDLAVSVSGSGQVATLGEVSIKPQTVGQAQTLGQIVSVKVQNGDFVKAGQVIAILDGQNALQSLNQAKASVESAQASYNKLVNGPTASDLQSINNSIQSDKTTITNDQQNITLSIQNAYSSISNSVYINTDPFFQAGTVTSVSPILSISGVGFTNQQLQTNVTTGRVAVGTALNQWDQEINSASSTNVVALLNDSISYLNQVRTYFDDMTSLFSLNSTGYNSAGLSTLNSDKSAASGALSSTNSSIGSLTSSLQSYNNAVTSLANDQQSLALKVAPANADDVTVAKSQLDNANANLANAEQNYQSRIITAPFDGQIGGLSAQLGQQISSSDSLGTLITAQRVINVTLNEVDSSKVAANDPVQITFSALPNLTIAGHVNFIDPLGTVTQGVVNYSVQIALDEQNDAIKTGMTATANIATIDHPNALMVPNSAITTSGNQKYVLVAQIASSTFMGNGGGFSSTSSLTGNRNFASSTFPGGYSGFNGTASSTFSSTTRQRSGSGQNIQFPANIQPTIVKVPVTVGISNTTQTEILSGLTEGQIVVTRTITGSAAATAKSAAAQATTRTTGGGAGGAIRVGGFGGGAVGGAGIGGGVRIGG